MDDSELKNQIRDLISRVPPHDEFVGEFIDIINKVDFSKQTKKFILDVTECEFNLYSQLCFVERVDIFPSNLHMTAYMTCLLQNIIAEDRFFDLVNYIFANIFNAPDQSIIDEIRAYLTEVA